MQHDSESGLTAREILAEIIANLGPRSPAEREAIYYVESGTLDRFEEVAYDFAEEVRCGARERQRTVDFLQALAMFVGLPIIIGNDVVQDILSRAFGGKNVP